MLVDTPSSVEPSFEVPSSFSTSKSNATATTPYWQLLCANAEGWSPLSPFRYDFTPRFFDVWILTVAVFGTRMF
jgi:hypothetical protein